MAVCCVGVSYIKFGGIGDCLTSCSIDECMKGFILLFGIISKFHNLLLESCRIRNFEISNYCRFAAPLMANYFLLQFVKCNCDFGFLDSKLVNAKTVMRKLKFLRRFLNGGWFRHGLGKNSLWKENLLMIMVLVFEVVRPQGERYLLMIV